MDDCRIRFSEFFDSESEVKMELQKIGYYLMVFQ